MHDSNSPVAEYQSFAEVVQETRDIYVVDLVSFAARMDRDSLALLAPPPMGVWLRASLEPIMIFGESQKYYSLSQYKNFPGIPNIHGYQDFIDCKEPIIDGRGKIICNPPFQLKQYFQDYCSFNYSAIHLVVASVWNILRSLHQDAHPCSPLPKHYLDEVTWIKEGMIPDFYRTQIPPVADVVEQVLKFVGRDHCSVYSMSLQNTTLHVAKGNDFRVIDYYRRIFEAHEAERFEKFGY